MKSLVLLSGETGPPPLQFLHQNSRLPGLFVYSDDDEYPPTPKEMQLLYAASPSPAKRLIHYSTANEAPWLWYETFLDTHLVPAKGGHGTDLFEPHPELREIIVQWLVTTLIKTPGHAPADPMAAAPILMDVEFGGGVTRATRQLLEARKHDPDVQLWPEESMTSVGRISVGRVTFAPASKSSSSIFSPIPIRPIFTRTSRKATWAPARTISHGSPLKEPWRCSARAACPHRRGPIPSSIAARSATVQKTSSRS